MDEINNVRYQHRNDIRSNVSEAKANKRKCLKYFIGKVGFEKPFFRVGCNLIIDENNDNDEICETHGNKKGKEIQLHILVWCLLTQQKKFLEHVLRFNTQ